MSSMSLVNAQITDAVSQTNATVIGTAAAQSFGILDAVMSETIGMAMHNAVGNQRNMQMVSSAAVSATCARILNSYAPPPPKPAPPPTPPAPPRAPDPSAALAQGTQSAKAAIAKVITDASQAAGSVSAATTGLKEIEDQAQQGIDNINKTVGVPTPPPSSST